MIGKTKEEKRKRAVHLMFLFGAATAVTFGVTIGSFWVGSYESSMVLSMTTIALIIATLGSAIYVIAEEAQKNKDLEEIVQDNFDESKLDDLEFR